MWCRGQQTRRHDVLPGSAPPRWRAVRRPDPDRPWYVRVLDSTGANIFNRFVNIINGLMLNTFTTQYSRV